MDNILPVLVSSAHEWFRYRKNLSFEKRGDQIIFSLNEEQFFRYSVTKKIFISISRRGLLMAILHIESGESEYAFGIRPWEMGKAKAWASRLFQYSTNP
jgi:hypothetical protein